VVNALLEAGGRELLMLTRDDGTSCLFISAQNGHLEVVNALLEAGGGSGARAPGARAAASRLAAWLHCRRKPRGGSQGRAGGLAPHLTPGPASDAARDAGQAAADADAEGAEPLELRLRVRGEGQRPPGVSILMHARARTKTQDRGANRAGAARRGGGRGVMSEIEEAARKMPALYLRKLVLYVDMQGRCAKTKEVDHSFLAEEFATIIQR